MSAVRFRFAAEFACPSCVVLLSWWGNWEKAAYGLCIAFYFEITVVYNSI